MTARNSVAPRPAYPLAVPPSLTGAIAARFRLGPLAWAGLVRATWYASGIGRLSVLYLPNDTGAQLATEIHEVVAAIDFMDRGEVEVGPHIEESPRYGGSEAVFVGEPSMQSEAEVVAVVARLGERHSDGRAPEP